MRVIVPIKQILDPAGFVVRADLGRIFVNLEDFIINPCDKNALEETLRLKDEHGAEVIAVSLGEKRAEDALREALAMGADKAFLLTDKAFSDIDAAMATVVIGKAIERIGDYHLILTGQKALDTESDQLGPRLAEYLNLPQVLNVRELAIEDNRVKAKRSWGEGYIDIEVPLPAVLTIAPDFNKPRYPHGARIMNAYREQQVTKWGAADLDLTEEELQPLTEERRKTFPPPRKFGERITGPPEEVAKELARRLRWI